MTLRKRKGDSVLFRRDLECGVKRRFHFQRRAFTSVRQRPGDMQGETKSAFPITTVGALIFNPAREVLMIRTHKWSNLWGIPGGKIKWGETAEDALLREIKEETNLDVTNIQFAMVQDCIRSKEFFKEAHFVLLNYTCDTNSTAVILNDEAEEFQWLPLDRALTDLPLNAPTRILIEHVKHN